MSAPGPPGQPTRIGYALCFGSRDARQQHAQLVSLGCELIYIDRVARSATSDQPELDQALANCRPGATLVITDLERLAHHRFILKELRELLDRQIALEISNASMTYTWSDATSRMLLAHPLIVDVVPELMRLHARAAARPARATTATTASRTKLNPDQQHAVRLLDAAGRSQSQIAADFGVSRSTISRILSEKRLPPTAPTPKPSSAAPTA